MGGASNQGKLPGGDEIGFERGIGYAYKGDWYHL